MRVVIKSVRVGGATSTNLGAGRGRNGWFDVADVEVAVHPDGSFRIDIYSKRRGDMPPITFSLPDVQRRTLIQALRGDLPAEGE